MTLVTAKNIVVEFPIYDVAHRSLRKELVNATTGGRIARDSGNRVTVRALDGVTFTLKPGDRVGLIGHNGAGKSTLLRVLSGIYEPVQGELLVQGRVASLFELSPSMDNEASGYEYIHLRGLLMGQTPKEIRNKVDDIAEFTGLGAYLDMPVRTYSSGMQLRLAFAVSTAVDADIILMDEWLDVGDKEFQPKAITRVEELVVRASILVVASHDPQLLRGVCNRIFRLEHGKVAEVGIGEIAETRAACRAELPVRQDDDLGRDPDP
jgi:lipopolysaccharide transport system ATP-binding protein